MDNQATSQGTNPATEEPREDPVRPEGTPEKDGAEAVRTTTEEEPACEPMTPSQSMQEQPRNA